MTADDPIKTFYRANPPSPIDVIDAILRSFIRDPMERRAAAMDIAVDLRCWNYLKPEHHSLTPAPRDDEAKL